MSAEKLLVCSRFVNCPIKNNTSTIFSIQSLSIDHNVLCRCTIVAIRILSHYIVRRVFLDYPHLIRVKIQDQQPEPLQIRSPLTLSTVSHAFLLLLCLWVVTNSQMCMYEHVWWKIWKKGTVTGRKQPLGAVWCRPGSSTVVVNSISFAICSMA